MGTGARSADRSPGGYPRHRPLQAGVLHRARPDAGADRPVGAAVRHPQLGGARRLLFGQHGGGRPVFHRFLVLGIRRARLGLRQVLPDVGRGGRPLLQPDQDRPGKAQAPWRQVRLRQPGAHRLFGDRRRMAADQARHGRPARHVDGARAAEARTVRLRIPGALHQRVLAGGAEPGAEGRRPVPARRERPAADLGYRQGSLQERHRRRHRPGAVRRIRGAGRPPRQDRDVADGRALSRRALRAGERGAGMRPAGRDHRAHRAGNGARRVQGNGRAADRVDRRVGPQARQGRRPPGGDVRDARHCGALQRLPFLPRDPHDPDAAGRARRARATSAPARRIRSRFRRTSCRKTTSTSSTRRTRRCRVRRSASRRVRKTW